VTTSSGATGTNRYAEGADVLIGGAGNDTLDGGGGFDTCVGEIVRNCEAG
jgi:hypothetical protein